MDIDTIADLLPFNFRRERRDNSSGEREVLSTLLLTEAEETAGLGFNKKYTTSMANTAIMILIIAFFKLENV